MRLHRRRSARGIGPWRKVCRSRRRGRGQESRGGKIAPSLGSDWVGLLTVLRLMETKAIATLEPGRRWGPTGADAEGRRREGRSGLNQGSGPGKKQSEQLEIRVWSENVVRNNKHRTGRCREATGKTRRQSETTGTRGKGPVTMWWCGRCGAPRLAQQA